MLFGTFENPQVNPPHCGFDPPAEDRLEDMLAFRDANETATEEREPLQFLPTCIGCSKRWACQLAVEGPNHDFSKTIDANAKSGTDAAA